MLIREYSKVLLKVVLLKMHQFCEVLAGSSMHKAKTTEPKYFKRKEKKFFEKNSRTFKGTTIK